MPSTTERVVPTWRMVTFLALLSVGVPVYHVTFGTLGQLIVPFVFGATFFALFGPYRRKVSGATGQESSITPSPERQL